MKRISAPTFDRVPLFKPPVYVWYTWNPRSPRWERTCWAFPTKEEALESLHATSAPYYHYKLIYDDGLNEKYVVVEEILPDFNRMTERAAALWEAAQ